tara:strand:- start:347 stop:1243 length:897 start_codon:yes stop_codon:yes gene_type:complete
MTQKTNSDFYCGHIAIIGRPNVGKSTLMNMLIDNKVSITSKKAQTTRHRITGIQTSLDTQFIYFDTPGYQTKYNNLLNSNLNKTVIQTFYLVDVILFVVESNDFGFRDIQLLKLLPKDIPSILVINKSDRKKNKNELLELASKISCLKNFDSIVPISSKFGSKINILKDEVKKFLPKNNPIYSSQKKSDQSEIFFASEIVREKVFRFVGEELPYTSTVVIDKLEKKGKLRRIFASILVNRNIHKAIIIGKDGSLLKKISSKSRIDLEFYFDAPVYLEIFVKVKSGWADNEFHLRSYGY